ncbi:hypothetical protein VaNZ11_009298 [Volvox africanus]|uniref:Zinc-finger domain-containing protein n=1 Tax=Volvox africanus TaxID=51714 RepID=A0ABQ5S928_9CHLO|nr:hypothetical protein VaNZ11_009298 [Volvox africanus]
MVSTRSRRNGGIEEIQPTTVDARVKPRATAKDAAVRPEDNAAAPVTDLDAERARCMARNAEALQRFGIKAALDALLTQAAAVKGKASATNLEAKGTKRSHAHLGQIPVRRSKRLAGAPAPGMVEFDDNGNLVQQGESCAGLLDLMENGDARIKPGIKVDELTDEQRTAINVQRCSSKSRGGIYHQRGLTCHFCRQKKLCGEDDCPRCSTQNWEADCIGKTFCRACLSANGIFCRACLIVRYGQDLDEVRADPTWLCPHCYVDKHGHYNTHGWLCNSSICLRREKIAPTGIAIHEAIKQGYPSVAHMLQARLLKKAKEAAHTGAGRGTAQTATSTHAENHQQRLTTTAVEVELDDN